MSATSDVARMLTLVPWLLERPGASIEETAEAFGVDGATIREDLGHLDFCGLPGLGGGALFEVTTVADRVVLRMADELRRPLRPTAGEALRLVLTVDAVAEAIAEEVPALRSAVDKVRASVGLPEHVADVVDPDDHTILARVRDAIARGRQVTFRYQGRNDRDPQQRRIDPWALHVVDGIWYVQGHDHTAEARRAFRLDRIGALEVSGEPMLAAAPAELETPRYVSHEDDPEVVVDVDAAGRWLGEAVTLERSDPLPGGGERLVFRTDALGWVAGLVVMAGGHATVVAPGGLRERVRATAASALERYER